MHATERARILTALVDAAGAALPLNDTCFACGTAFWRHPEVGHVFVQAPATRHDPNKPVTPRHDTSEGAR